LTPNPLQRPIDIPPELVLHILEEAYRTEDLTDGRSLLKNCALVCRAWSPLAQKLLFRDVALRDEPSFASFRRAVDPRSSRGRTLGHCVLRLGIVIDIKNRLCLSHASFAQAVVLCPNLYELRLSLFSRVPGGERIFGVPRPTSRASGFDETVIQSLRSGPMVTSLQLSNWTDDYHILPQLLDTWPAIKSLALNGVAAHLPDASIRPPPPCALERLRMNVQFSPNADFMSWLLRNSAGVLRILHFDRDPSAAMLDSVFDVHAETLESLAIPTCSSYEHVPSMRRCRRLRELKLYNPWAVHTVLKQLPCDVEHIALGVTRNTVLNAVLEMVRSHQVGEEVVADGATGPRLKDVIVYVYDGGERHPLLPALQVACACKGVRLRLTRDVRDLRALFVSPRPALYSLQMADSIVVA